jgi:hypothetical protein
VTATEKFPPGGYHFFVVAGILGVFFVGGEQVGIPGGGAVEAVSGGTAIALVLPI